MELAIGEIWESRASLDASSADVRAPVHAAVELLDSGSARVAEVVDDQVVVHEWLKKAILLYFAITPNSRIEVGPFEIFDKVPLKTGFERAGVRALPGSVARC